MSYVVDKEKHITTNISTSPTTGASTLSGAEHIVPLYVPGQKVFASPPQLIYNNGPLLTAVEVFTVFWGSAWQQAPLSNTLQNLNSFFDTILTSSVIDQLAEYSTAQYQIGHGSHVGTATITTPDVSSSVTDSDIQQLLQNQIANNSAFPQVNANTLYFVYLPNGVTVQLGGSSSCQAFCGYHDNVNGQLFYGVIPYPDCSGCISNLAVFEAITTVSSHELCEAITDPIPGQGWYDQSNGEIGDICAWQTKQVAGYTVQLEWSNNANSCV